MRHSKTALTLALAGSLYLGTSVGQAAAPRAPGAPPPPAPVEVLEVIGVEGERLTAARTALAAHHDRMMASKDQLHDELAAILSPEELELFFAHRRAPRAPAPPAAPERPGRGLSD